MIHALGGVTRADVQALLGQHREAEATAARAISQVGADFVRGIETTLGANRKLARYRKPAYSGHALAYTAMGIIADAVAAVPFKLWKREKDGSPGEEITQHPILDLLEDPFPELYSDGAQFIELLVLYLLASGNAWLLLDDVSSSTTKLPVSLSVFGAQHVAPRIDAHSWRLLGWQFRYGASPRQVSADYFAHVKLAHPDSGPQILGLGPVQAAQADLDIDFARARYQEDFFVHGASPGMKMKWDPSDEQVKRGLAAELTKDQMDAVKEKFKDEFEGSDKAHKTAFLNAGWSLESLGMSQRDMEFVQQELSTLRRICAVFRVSSILFNDREHASFSAEQFSAAEQALAHARTVPLCKRLTRFLNRVLVQPFYPAVIGGFDTDEIEALHDRFDAKVTNFVKLVGEGRVSPKAANALVDLGLDPDTLSDEALVPFSVLPASQVYDIDRLTARPALASPADDAAPRLLLPQPRALPAPTMDRAASRLARWRALVATYAPVERGYRLQVRRHVFNLRDEVLDNLAAHFRGARAIDPAILRAILFDPLSADEVIRLLSLPFFEDAITIGATGIGEEVGAVAIGLDAPAARAALALKESKIVGINDTIADALRVTLTEGFDAGENLNDLAARVRGVFNASATRARVIARTEIAQGVNMGRFVEMGTQGIEEHSWLSSADIHVRDAHRIDGERRRLGEPFSNTMRFPGDPDAPPELSINDRCSTVPEVPGT
jgi:HK97 family phage portal protein